MLGFSQTQDPDWQSYSKHRPALPSCQPTRITIHVHRMRTLLPNAQRLGLQSLVPALCNAQVWGQDRYLPRNRVRAKIALMDQHQCRGSSGTPAASSWNWEADVGQSMAAALRAAKTSSGRLSAEVLQHICAPAFSTSHSGCTSQGTASPISLWPTTWKQKS